MYFILPSPFPYIFYKLTKTISAANQQTTFWDTIKLQKLEEGQLTNRVIIKGYKHFYH